MKHKKHRQLKGVHLNYQHGLRVGGIVIPYWPSYWNGISSGDGHHGEPIDYGNHAGANEGANDGNGTGYYSSGSSDGGAGVNT